MPAPASIPANDPTDDTPFPPRFWWTKRIAVAAAVLLALLGIARLIWGWDANRRPASGAGRHPLTR